jgi:hypothetical protein
MIAYYQLAESLATHLQNDTEINTVMIGGIDTVDLNKRSIFGMAHIGFTTASFLGGVVRFVVSITVMDLVDEDKLGDEKTPHAERWKGNDNKQDVLNNMLAVIERLDKAIKNDTLTHTGLMIVGDEVAEPFEDRFENLLTGWTKTFTIDMPNNVQNC